MSAIPVVPVSEAIYAMKRGETICFIQSKQVKKGKDGKVEPPKRYNGCLYFDVLYKIKVFQVKYENNAGKTVLISLPTEDAKLPDDVKNVISRTTVTKECADFSYTNLKTTKAPLDPNDKDDPRYKMQVRDGKVGAPTIQTSIKNAGEAGEFLLLLTPQINAAIKAAGAEDSATFIQYFDIEGLRIIPIVKTRISKSAPEKAGELLDDPIIYIKSPIGKYPANFPKKALQNQRKSVFVDYLSRRVVLGKNGKPKKEYDRAVLLDETGDALLNDAGEKQVVDETNLYKYLKYGSMVNEGRFNCGTICISNLGVSLGVESTWAACTPVSGSSNEEVEYEDDYVDEQLTVTAVATSSAPTETVTKQVKTPVTVSATTANSLTPAESQAVDDLLDEL